jgi:hypothetical protein
MGLAAVGASTSGVARGASGEASIEAGGVLDVVPGASGAAPGAGRGGS